MNATATFGSINERNILSRLCRLRKCTVCVHRWAGTRSLGGTDPTLLSRQRGPGGHEDKRASKGVRSSQWPPRQTQRPCSTRLKRRHKGQFRTNAEEQRAGHRSVVLHCHDVIPTSHGRPPDQESKDIRTRKGAQSLKPYLSRWHSYHKWHNLLVCSSLLHIPFRSGTLWWATPGFSNPINIIVGLP